MCCWLTAWSSNYVQSALQNPSHVLFISSEWGSFFCFPQTFQSFQHENVAVCVFFGSGRSSTDNPAVTFVQCPMSTFPGQNRCPKIQLTIPYQKKVFASPSNLSPFGRDTLLAPSAHYCLFSASFFGPIWRKKVHFCCSMYRRHVLHFSTSILPSCCGRCFYSIVSTQFWLLSVLSLLFGMPSIGVTIPLLGLSCAARTYQLAHPFLQTAE